MFSSGRDMLQEIQTVIPGAASYGPLATDFQMVSVFNTSVTVELARLMSDRRNERFWLYQQYDLTNFAGQTVVLYFGAFNDGAGGKLGYYLDEVVFEVCQ